ncbi:MAG: phosphodiester glycosidase family protein [Oscillospiraceae bacterium]|nr:phosphodiester glycosidase family protein [Oscillospiraceae bacterium]
MKKLFFILFLASVFLPGCEAAKKHEASYALFEQDDFTVIKTRAENIKPETIKSPICSDYIRELGYYGINAGFFNTVYRGEKPSDEDFFSVSISWSKEDEEKGLEVCEINKRDPEKIALGEGPYIARGTLFFYMSDGKYEAGVMSAESSGDLREQIKQKTNRDHDYIYMIGGGNFYLGEYPEPEDWENWKEQKYQNEGPLVIENSKTGRSGIGIKKENGIWYAYLACSGTNSKEKPKTLEELRALFISLGCFEAIYLDGAGSSQMRCFGDDGELVEKRGDDRYIWAMVRIVVLE